MNGNSTSPSASSYFCQLGSIKSEHQVELEGRNWKAETENGACRCRGIGRDPGVAGDLSSSRLKLPHPTNHNFSDSLVLVVEPLVFAVCIAGSTDSLSTQLSFDSTWPDSLGPGDRLRPTQTQRSTVRFSVLFSRNHARISRENTRPDGNSRGMRRYSLPAAALCSGDIIFHRDGPPLAKEDSILHSSTNGRGVLRLLYGSPPSRSLPPSRTRRLLVSRDEARTELHRHPSSIPPALHRHLIHRRVELVAANRSSQEM